MGKIVVGIDGSEQSKDALRFALDEGELRRVQVLAVHAWTMPIAPDPLLVSPPVDYPLLFAGVQEGAERLLENVVEEVLGAQPRNVQAEREAIEGPPATVLLRAAEGADMLVVGSRGRGGFARLVLGSVSEQVARHAPCPVLIHRRATKSDH